MSIALEYQDVTETTFTIKELFTINRTITDVNGNDFRNLARVRPVETDILNYIKEIEFNINFRKATCYR